MEVEVDYTAGMPGMTIVGLPDAAIQESRERVQAAMNLDPCGYYGDPVKPCTCSNM